MQQQLIGALAGSGLVILGYLAFRAARKVRAYVRLLADIPERLRLLDVDSATLQARIAVFEAQLKQMEPALKALAAKSAKFERFAYNRPAPVPTVEEQDLAFDRLTEMAAQIEALAAAGMDRETAGRQILEQSGMLGGSN